MKTALITGVTGQDGSFLAELLLQKGYTIIGTKRRTSIINTSNIDHIYNHPRFKMIYSNMNDVGSMYKILNDYKPDEIYNLAAQSHVRVSFDVPEETVDCIALGTMRLIEAVRNIVPNSKFYQASSSEMYGDNPEELKNELTRMTPASPYAAAKLFGHNIVRNYREGYGMFACSGILFNHESSRRGETFVTRKVILGALDVKYGKSDKLILGNLDAKRDWGYAGDFVEAMWLMLQQEKPDDYVIATGETHSVKELVEVAFDYAGLDWKKYVIIDDRLKRPHEVPHLLGDYTKAKNVLKWEPKIRFNDLIKLMFDHDEAKYYKENK
jgi:GDPmannose 4,6-dehydratase